MENFTEDENEELINNATEESQVPKRMKKCSKYGYKTNYHLLSRGKNDLFAQSKPIFHNLKIAI